MVKSVVGANVGHCLVMRHHYMRLMSNLQQPSEQYWLIAALSHGKSPCASSPHLHRELPSCLNLSEPLVPRVRFGRVFRESKCSGCLLLASAVSSIRPSLNINAQLFFTRYVSNVLKTITKQHFLTFLLMSLFCSSYTSSFSSWYFSPVRLST